MATAFDIALAALKRDEGFRPKVYTDTVGRRTAGYGRNLDDKGLTEAEAAFLLRNDVMDAERALAERLRCWGRLSEARKAVLINMAVNLGPDGLFGFKKTIAFVEAGRYAEAAEEMLRSKWATQVGDRAQRLSTQMRYGA